MQQKLHLAPGSEGRAIHVCAPMVRYPAHHHQELEINLVLSGHAAYLIGSERVPIVVGSMIWLFPEQEHVLIDCSHDFAMWILIFSPALVERNTRHLTREILRLGDPGAIFCRQLEPEAVEALHAICQGMAIDKGDVEFTNAALGYVLVASWQAFQFSRDPIARTDVHPAVAKAVRILSGSEEVIPLPELARRAGLSAPRLSRLFKQQTGVSLTVFRQQRCLERFRRIFRSGSRYSLIEAALLAGFGSYPQFHRVFRRHMRQSPAEYSRSVKQEG